jgi:hypothetical protein
MEDFQNKLYFIVNDVIVQDWFIDRLFGLESTRLHLLVETVNKTVTTQT